MKARTRESGHRRPLTNSAQWACAMGAAVKTESGSDAYSWGVADAAHGRRYWRPARENIHA